MDLDIDINYVNRMSLLALYEEVVRDDDNFGHPAPVYFRRDVKCNLFNLFHENTKWEKHQFKDVVGNIIEHSSPHMLKAITESWSKVCLNNQFISLPKPSEPKCFKGSIAEALKSRRSVRNFTGNGIELNKLSDLLYYSYGMTDTMKVTHPHTGNEYKIPLRTAPTAGGLNSIDIYVGSLNMKNLERGCYLYNAKHHSLYRILLFDDIAVKTFIRNFPAEGIVAIESASFIILLIANLWRTVNKYGVRGYRFILQETGHIMQNIYLMSASLSIGCVALGVFEENKIAKKLMLMDGEAVMYAAVIGDPSNRGG